MNDKPKAQIMDDAAMRRAINRICYEIVERNNGAENIIIVGIIRRGAVLAQRIAERIETLEGITPQVAELDVRPFRDDVPREEGQARASLPIDVQGMRVILVDDVLHTGRTVRAAIDAIFSAGRPENIQLATMIDRGHRELPIRPDYVGKNLPTAKSEVVRVMVLEVDGTEAVTIDDKEGQAHVS
ncbi:MAG: bifunctional pyr operon transcriptional regulator/uracil phosphoribosyltransferase PyrR [Clostridia bacterium]